jgi:hypothetical protein
MESGRSLGILEAPVTCLRFGGLMARGWRRMGEGRRVGGMEVYDWECGRLYWGWLSVVFGAAGSLTFCLYFSC